VSLNWTTLRKTPPFWHFTFDYVATLNIVEVGVSFGQQGRQMKEARKNRLLFCVYLTLLVAILGCPVWAAHWFSSRTELFQLADDVTYPPADTGFLGIDWNAMRNPISLRFSPSTRLSKSQIQMIAGFGGLKSLTIGRLNNADLEVIRGLKALYYLKLMEASISDHGLTSIGENLSLRELRISATTDDQQSGGQLTAAGMTKLASMNSLRILTFTSHLLTDETIAPLGRCISLEALALTSRNIHGDGLRHLQTLSRLFDLRLDGCAIDNSSGLRSLSANAALRQVWLRECGRLDEPIQAIANLTQVERLHLQGSQVTDSAIIQLRTAHPNLQIFDPSGRLWIPGEGKPQVVRRHSDSTPPTHGNPM